MSETKKKVLCNGDHLSAIHVVGDGALWRNGRRHLQPEIHLRQEGRVGRSGATLVDPVVRLPDRFEQNFAEKF